VSYHCVHVGGMPAGGSKGWTGWTRGSDEDGMFTHMRTTLDLSHYRQDVTRPSRSRDGRLHAVRTPSLMTSSPLLSSLHRLLSHYPHPSLHIYHIRLVSHHTNAPCSHDQFRLRVNMYTIKKEREITPVTFTHLVSSTLYKLRFGPYFIEPVVAGLEPIPMPGAAEAAATATTEGGEREGV
jgi:hypothetical protein